jgi:hypothetical protein
MTNVTCNCTRLDAFHYAFETWENLGESLATGIILVLWLVLVGLGVTVIVMGIWYPIQKLCLNRAKIREDVIRELQNGNYVGVSDPVQL